MKYNIIEQLINNYRESNEYLKIENKIKKELKIFKEVEKEYKELNKKILEIFGEELTDNVLNLYIALYSDISFIAGMKFGIKLLKDIKKFSKIEGVQK